MARRLSTSVSVKGEVCGRRRLLLLSLLVRHHQNFFIFFSLSHGPSMLRVASSLNGAFFLKPQASGIRQRVPLRLPISSHPQSLRLTSGFS